MAYNRAKRDVHETGSLDVPLHFRNASTTLMKDLGYGKNYSYDPDVEGGIDYAQIAFPEALGEPVYYEPVAQGAEMKIAEKLARIRALRKTHSSR
jgi:putative ATPase